MHQVDMLQQARRSAVADYYADGLTELVAGGVLFIVALAAGRPAFAWTYLLIIVLLGPGLRRLKARFSDPRIGYLQLEKPRTGVLQRGLIGWLVLVFALCGLLLLILGQANDHLAWRRIAPCLAGLLFAGGFAYLAQQSHRVHHWLLALASIGIGLVSWIPRETVAYGNLRIWALLLSLVCLATGALMLGRFLRAYPVIDRQDRTDA